MSATEHELLGELKEELLETAIQPGERTVDTSQWRNDPLSLHAHRGDNLFLRWKGVPIDARTIDVVVHLHGYISRNPNTDTLKILARRSGLDLAGRTRPTLAILPLGRRITEKERLRNQELLNEQARKLGTNPKQARDDVYTFPALTAGNGVGLELLVSAALRWFGSEVLRRGGAPPQIGRLILTAHSGGGAALNSLAANSTLRPVCNPDEVHMFDGLYGEATGLKRWVAGRLAADRRRSAGDMSAQGGGLRVFYRPNGTQRWSEELALSLPGQDHPLRPWYRAECTTADHGEIPNEFGPPLLRDRARNLSLGIPCKGGNSRRSPPRSIPSKRQRPHAAPPCKALPAPERAELPRDVRGWILSPDRSAIELIATPTLRNRFLRAIDWKQEYFPGNPDATGRSVEGRLAEELFNAVVRVVPERRVPSCINFRPDIGDIRVRIPGQRDWWLHPEASEAFVRMRQTAAKDGVPLHVISAWRSAKKQAQLRSRNKNPKAVAHGAGPHMYGLAVDLRLSMPSLQVAEANTHLDAKQCKDLKMASCEEKMANIVKMYRSPVYKWMALNGSRFGWFPYRREPWHWEYNPPGFKERYEGWPGKNREVEFEGEFDLEEELEDEAAELDLVFPP
jgi:hypothetical protein